MSRFDSPRLSLCAVLVLLSLGCGARCGFAATPQQAAADSKLAAWKIAGKAAVPVYPGMSKEEQSADDSHPEISIGSPVGKPLFFLRPGETVDIVDIFETSHQPESEYTCKVRNHSQKTGFITCGADIQWTGERGSLVRILLDQPYEYEGDVELVAEEIKRFWDYIDHYPSSRFVAFAKLKILWLRLYILQALTLDIPGDLRGLKEEGQLFGDGKKVDVPWTPKARKLYAEFVKQKGSSDSPEVLTAFSVVDELLKAVPSPMSQPRR